MHTPNSTIHCIIADGGYQNVMKRQRRIRVITLAARGETNKRRVASGIYQACPSSIINQNTVDNRALAAYHHGAYAV